MRRKYCYCRHFVRGRQCRRDCGFAHADEEISRPDGSCTLLWERTRLSIVDGCPTGGVIPDWWFGQKLNPDQLKNLALYGDISARRSPDIPEPSWAKCARHFYGMQSCDPSLGADYIRSEYARLIEDATYGGTMQAILWEILEEELKPILDPNCRAGLPVKKSITPEPESDAKSATHEHEDEDEEKSGDANAIDEHRTDADAEAMELDRDYEGRKPKRKVRKRKRMYDDADAEAMELDRDYEGRKLKRKVRKLKRMYDDAGPDWIAECGIYVDEASNDEHCIDSDAVADAMEPEQVQEGEEELADSLPDELEQLGIDIYQVVIDYGLTLCEYNSTPTDEDLAAAAQIVQLCGKDYSWLLSFSGKEGQLATIRELLGVDFFHKTGWRRDRIIFCSSRTGSMKRPLTMADMKPVENSPIVGPVYAPHGYGKGAIGKLYGFHALIDDKHGVLYDFAEWNPDALLLQAAWYREPYGNYICKKARLCRTWGAALAGLRRSEAAHYVRDEDIDMPVTKHRRM